MQHLTKKVLVGLCMAALCLSVNAQQLGMSAKVHFKNGDIVRTVSTFAPTAKECEMEVRRLIDQNNGIGYQTLGRTECVGSIATDERVLQNLADKALSLDFNKIKGKYTEAAKFGHADQDVFVSLDLCTLYPHLPICMPDICHPLWCPPICYWCDLFESDLAGLINPIDDRLAKIEREYQIDVYLNEASKLRQKFNMSGFADELQGLQKEVDQLVPTLESIRNKGDVNIDGAVAPLEGNMRY